MPKRSSSAYRYVSDDGVTYAVTLTDDQFAETGFGWVAATDEPDLPKRYRMRYAILHDPADPSRQFRRPVATVDAPVWTAPLAAARPIDQWNEAGDVNCMVTSLIGERRSWRLRPVPA